MLQIYVNNKSAPSFAFFFLSHCTEFTEAVLIKVTPFWKTFKRDSLNVLVKQEIALNFKCRYCINNTSIAPPIRKFCIHFQALLGKLSLK